MKFQEKTGIRFRHSVTLLERVTVSFKSLPVEQALERLFGPEADFILHYDRIAYSPVSLPKEVWILGKVRADQAKAMPTPAKQRSNELTTATRSSAQTVTEVVDVAAPEQIEFDTLMEMTKSNDAMTRVQALSALADRGRGDPDAIRSVLDAALMDEDPSVRGYAVQALVSQPGSEALNYLSQALRDPDAEVRIMAVESTPSEEAGLSLLREALSDTDEMVRAIARNRLQEAESQPAH